MTTFYICRHGQTENNKSRRLSGWIDTPLTNAGVKNATSSANKLKGKRFDKIVSSDLGRAFITAYIISRELGYLSDIERYPQLREVNYGKFANMPYAGTDSVYPMLSPEENTYYIPPNGESLAQMQHRVMTFIAKLTQESPHKTILIAAHDGTINAVYASFVNQDIGTVDSNSANPHDFVAKFVCDTDKIISFNELKS